MTKKIISIITLLVIGFVPFLIFAKTGDIVNVKSLVVDKTTLKSGDVADLKIAYIGNLSDILAFAPSGTSIISDSADLSVKLFNENDRLVGEYNENINVINDLVKTFSITAGESASAVYAVASFVKDGKVIGSYTSKLSSDFDAVKEKTQGEFFNNVTLVVSVVIILSVIIFFIIRLFGKKGLNKK